MVENTLPGTTLFCLMADDNDFDSTLSFSKGGKKKTQKAKWETYRDFIF